MRQSLVRLAEVEWQMRRTLAKSCPRQSAATGIALDYIGAYAQRDRSFVKAQTGLGDLPTIIAVPDQSPAQVAGLRVGDEILAIDGESTRKLAEKSAEPALLADDIQDRIAARSTLAEIAFSVRRGGETLTIPVTPARVCGARIILDADDAIEAHSDGENIAVTTGLVRFTRNDDELALVAGHEMAHVVLDGERRAGLFGSRAVENRADLVGARYARCAGYDVARAIAFWPRFGAQDRFGWLRSSSHGSASERERRLRAALPGLSCRARPAT